MDNVVRDLRSELRTLHSIKNIAEKGNLVCVGDILKNRGADSSLRTAVENIFQAALKDYVRENTGGMMQSQSISNPSEILDQEEFGKKYFGQKIQEEIDKKSTMIIDLECLELNSIYG